MKNQRIHISVFYCSNSLKQDALDFLSKNTEGIIVNSISLPCSGKVNLLYILKSIEMGSDGVVLVTCKFGECKFLQGNFRAQKRIGYVNDLLSEIGFETEHVRFVSLEDTRITQTLLSTINELAETLRSELLGIQK
ncbi:MAG TPA: hydrogenase iron-sulfur subunit [Bacteroidales bacterium]|jgi:coenzyme F420-reducing hydrogenase delta subunit|nr:hydrogenase iron-sulfur subunit [Bacteroidales bacterium]